MRVGLKLDSVLLACVLLFLSTGCETRRDTWPIQYPPADEPYQEGGVRLSAYRPPQERQGAQDSTVAVAVAISGGGHRAANFGIGVLWGLEEIRKSEGAPDSALTEVDYFSTVSGGSVAAGAYVSSLRDHLEFGGTQNDYSIARVFGVETGPVPPLDAQCYDPQLRAALAKNYESNLLRGAFAVGIHGNRGDHLERAFDDHVLGAKWRARKMGVGDDEHRSLTFGDIYAYKPEGKQEMRLPLWVPNASIYENQAIFPFVPDQLEFYKITGYKHRGKNCECSEKNCFRDVPLSVAMTASGNFPVAVPARTLKSNFDKDNGYLHLLDGGLADNLGIFTALRLLRQEKPQVKRKVLIVVDAYIGMFAPYSKTKSPPNMLMAALRTTTASLDSWHGRLHEVVRALANSKEFGDPKIDVVFVGFDDLDKLTSFDELKPFGLTDNDLKELKVAKRRVVPFQLLREIETEFKIKPEQQNLLIAAGRYAVSKMKRGEIEQRLWR